MNLHVVFTMNPSNDDFDNRSATSPALFNRCVIDWFGEWSAQALFQVGSEFTRSLDLSDVILETKETKGGPAPKKVRVRHLPLCSCGLGLIQVVLVCSACQAQRGR
jgi:dynein heavy chain 1